MRVGLCPGIRLSGWLRCFAYPSGGGVCTPCFCSQHSVLQAPQKWPLNFLVSVYLLSRICLTCTCTQLFLDPTVSLYFVAQGVVCPGTSITALQGRSQVPGLSTAALSKEQGDRLNTYWLTERSGFRALEVGRGDWQNVCS